MVRCGRREVRDGVRVSGFVKVGGMGSLFGGMVVVVEADVDVDWGGELCNADNSNCDGTSVVVFSPDCGGISGGVAWNGIVEV